MSLRRARTSPGPGASQRCKSKPTAGWNSRSPPRYGLWTATPHCWCWRAPLDMPRPPRLRRLSAGLLVGALGLLPVPMGSRAAGASAVDNKRAEAARIAAQLDAGAQRVADVAARLARAQARLQGTETALGRAAADLQAADARYGGLKTRLANQAVQAYVHGGSAVLVNELTHSR